MPALPGWDHKVRRRVAAVRSGKQVKGGDRRALATVGEAATAGNRTTRVRRPREVGEASPVGAGCHVAPRTGCPTAAAGGGARACRRPGGRRARRANKKGVPGRGTKCTDAGECEDDGKAEEECVVSDAALRRAGLRQKRCLADAHLTPPAALITKCRQRADASRPIASEAAVGSLL